MSNLPDFGDAHDKHLEDEADFRNLALGLLSTYSGLRADHILVGSIPEQWPADVPILEGSRIIGSLVRGSSHRENADDYTDLTLLSTIDLSPNDALDTYDELLLSVDWRTYDMVKKEGGFSTYSIKGDLEYFKVAQGVRLQVRARKAERMELAAEIEETDGPTEVCLCLDKDLGRLRRSRLGERSPLSSELLMPALRPPKRSEQWSAASNGSDSNWTSNISMRTELNIASLMSHYANQLAHAGWGPVGEGQSGLVMWSTWDVKDEHADAWVGALLILEVQSKRPGVRRRYHLSVHICRGE